MKENPTIGTVAMGDTEAAMIGAYRNAKAEAQTWCGCYDSDENRHYIVSGNEIIWEHVFKDYDAGHSAMTAKLKDLRDIHSLTATLPILKGVGKVNGDGWKDTTKKGEIVFVWNREHPKPYAAGQYPRVGKEHWSASTEQYDFTVATLDEIQALTAALSTRPAQEPVAEGLTDRIATLQAALYRVEGLLYAKGIPLGSSSYFEAREVIAKALNTSVMSELNDGVTP